MSEQTCGGTFEVRFQRSELRQIQSRAIRALVRNQIDLGVVRQVSPVEEILQFSVEKWRDAGRAPEDESDEELVDLWCSTQRDLADLFGVRSTSIALAMEGALGGRQARFITRIDGVRVGSEVEGPKVIRGDGTEFTMLPVAFASLFSQPPKEDWTRAAQIHAFARVHENLQRAQRLLDGQAGSVSVDLVGHLRDLKVTRFSKGKLGWTPTPGNDSLVSLRLELSAADGSLLELNPDKLDPAAPLASISSKEHYLLSDDIAAAARAAGTFRAKLPTSTAVREAMRDPLSVLPDGSAYTDLDLSEYGERVLGFGLRERAPIASPRSGVAWYQRDAHSVQVDLSPELESDDKEGRTAFSEDKAKEPPPGLANGSSAGGGGVTSDGTQDSPRATSGQPAAFVEVPGSEKRREPLEGKNLDVAIIKDVDSARAVPLLDSKGNDLPWDFLDRRLVAGRQLKGHQRDGISWLWQHYLSGHKGVVLADDMGLGKTLQIACFLTLLREFGRGDVRQRPILVVCPVILLANWKREIETSFTEALLVPEILEARELVVLSRNGFLAQKIEREHQSIFLLSYETMARHQRELLKVNWASVVFDEGHYLKNPTTFRTLAARGFKRDFGICLTGTPVENRLLDLWSLFDCVSPGVPFGSAKDFIGRYEEAEGGTVDLRAQLRYPSRDSPLLRRDRATHLPDLPPVREQTHLLPMTAEQVQMEEEVVKNNRSILKILGNLQKLYQHPRLLGRSGPSPKLAKTIEILRDIRARGEKAIVFTLWVEMQKLLAESIEDELQIDPVGIVNGDSNAAGTADATLARFRATRGFDVIILSPLAAGTGLTITEANHVIHYGRWWNPAKEDQATGRAYRLGQKKEVFVHYPLLHHPASIDRGFDVSLHKLVEKKRALATDFLRPTMLGDISRSEFDSVLGRDKK